MRNVCLLVIALSVSACVDWPDVPDQTTSRSKSDWPKLVSLDGLNGNDALVESETNSNEQLLARAGALRSRASVLRTPVPDQAAFDDLRDRISQ